LPESGIVGTGDLVTQLAQRPLEEQSELETLLLGYFDLHSGALVTVASRRTFKIPSEPS
jgi:hypothetical protein